MIIRKSGAVCAAVALAFALGGQAAAQETEAPAAPVTADGAAAPAPDKPKINITVGGEVKLSRQEQADAKALAAAFTDLSRGGFLALEKHVRALEKVLDNAPAEYPKVAVDGDMVIVRADPGQGMEDSLASGLVIAAMQQRSMTIAQTINIYPMASFMLGGYAVEKKDTDAAIAYLDRGLKLQPKAPMLLTEKGAAYQQARRPAEALAVYDAGLAPGGLFDIPSKKDRARLLRGRGISLIELGRLDEAVAAFEESLKEEPGNALAKKELAYIAGLKAGKPPTAVELIVPGAP